MKDNLRELLTSLQNRPKLQDEIGECYTPETWKILSDYAEKMQEYLLKLEGKASAFETELREKLDKISASAALHDRFWQGVRHQIREVLGESP